MGSWKSLLSVAKPKKNIQYFFLNRKKNWAESWLKSRYVKLEGLEKIEN